MNVTAPSPDLPADQASRLRAMVEAMRRGGSVPDAAPDRGEARPVQPEAKRAPIIAITSGKGGVGKTTLAVNVSIALAARSLRVTLVDADLGMANADVMCGLNPTRRLDRLISEPGRGAESLGVDAPGGFRLIPGAAGLAHLAGLDRDRYATLLDGLRDLATSSDALLIDTGAGIGPGVTTFCEGADLTIVVVTPEPTSIADAYGMIKCLARRGKLGIELPLLLVNQATSKEEARAVHARIAGVAERFLKARPSLCGWIPSDDASSRCVRKRVPLLLGEPDSRAAAGIRFFAGSVAERLGIDRKPPPRAPQFWGALSRIVGLPSGAAFADRTIGAV